MTSRRTRLRWWRKRQQLRLRLLLAGGELACGCHRHPTYGTVVMAGCEQHD